MAKAVALLSSALCILVVLAALPHGHEAAIFVEGDAYCDPCRVQFPNRFSEKLVAAPVKLECKNIDTKAVTYTVEGATDANGHYRLEVVGDHENEICEVNVVKSPRADCSEPMPDVEKSQITCTQNSGIHTDVRYANPIGFMTKNVLPQCTEVIQELIYQDDDDEGFIKGAQAPASLN